MSHLGVATKTWMALEEPLKESDGSDTAMSFWVYDMLCFEAFQYILLRKRQLRSTAIRLGHIIYIWYYIYT